MPTFSHALPISDEDSKRAETIVSRIAEKCEASPPPNQINIHSHVPLMGDLMLLGARNRRAKVMELCDCLNFSAFCFSGGLGLYGGAAGRVWAAMKSLQPETDCLLPCVRIVDDLILNCLRNQRFRLGTDLVSGIAGLALYVYDRPAPYRNRELELAILIRMIADIERTVDGMTVSCVADIGLGLKFGVSQGTKVCDLGMAHGLAGTLASFCLMYRTTPSGELGPILEGLSDALIAQINPVLGGYPHFVGGPRMVRPGWCYGHLSSGLALWEAARATKSARIESASACLFDEACIAPSQNISFADDGICHGTAGYMLVMARLYRETGNVRYSGQATGALHALVERVYANELRLDGVAILGDLTGIALALVGVLNNAATPLDQLLGMH